MQHTGHRNEMVLWDEIGCQRGCEHHATTTAHIDLSTPHIYHDYTQVPARFGQSFDIEVWDTSLTPVDGGPYCPARDAVSETILSHGIWEPQETAILMECFEQFKDQPARTLFVDIGCQIGWFSTLALRVGDLHVAAYDADPECLRVARSNLSRAWSDSGGKAGPNFHAYPLRLDARSAPSELHLDEWQGWVIAKIDIEGAEVDAIRMLQPLIDAGLVKYMLIEVSPIFNDSYTDLLNGLVSDGFVPYLLPPKRVPPVRIDYLTDLEGYELPHRPEDIAEFIAGIQQVNLFLALGGIR